MVEGNGKRPKAGTRADKPGHVLITGYPGFIARRLVRRLMTQAPRARITVLAEDRARAEADLAQLPVERQRRMRITTGDVTRMDCGLAGLEIDALADVTHVFHLAGVQRLDAPRELLEAVNVGGVRNTLGLAREMGALRRFVHFSSCLVSGDREGVITEDELDVGQRFHTHYEETKHKGERLARAAMKDLPITIVRPSIVVGSSETGEIDRFDGVYQMAILVVTSPISVPLPLPGPGTAPLNLVPVDFVTKAVLRLAFDPRAVGQTFHIVDPSPLSARHVYELIARRAGKRVPKSDLGSSLAARLLRLPGIDRLSRRRLPELSALDRFVVFNCANTLSLLDGTGIACPRFDTYVDKLMGFVSESLTRDRAQRSAAAADPLDG